MIFASRPLQRERPVMGSRPVLGARPIHPPNPSPLNPLGWLSLKDYQVEGAQWLRDRRGALLADEMGLGKTAQALRALPGGAATIVVCPASVRGVWRDECAKWRPDLKPVVLPAGRFQVPNRSEVLVVSFESLPDLPARKGQRWLVSDPRIAQCHLLVDEGHRCKNVHADRSQKVAMLARQCRTRWVLTGTPLHDKPMDLWGLLQVFGLGWTFCPRPEHVESKELWGAREHFVELFGGRKKRGVGMSFPAVPPGAEEIRERLARVTLRREVSQVAKDLPPVVLQDIPVTLEGAESLTAELERLASVWQYVEDLPPFEELAGVRADLAAHKIGAAVEVAEEHEEAKRPLIVFSAHRSPIDVLGRRAGWAIITGEQSERERNEAVRAFQAGELLGLAMTIQAGGVGLTLTRASDMLFVDLAYTPAENDQAIARIVRHGQKAKRVFVKRLVAEHAVERRLYELLDEKSTRIGEAIRPTNKRARSAAASDAR